MVWKDNVQVAEMVALLTLMKGIAGIGIFFVSWGLFGFLGNVWKIVSLRIRIVRIVHTIVEVGLFIIGDNADSSFGWIVGDIRVIVVNLRQLEKAPKLNALMVLLECDVGSHTWGAKLRVVQVDRRWLCGD